MRSSVWPRSCGPDRSANARRRLCGNCARSRSTNGDRRRSWCSFGGRATSAARMPISLKPSSGRPEPGPSWILSPAISPVLSPMRAASSIKCSRDGRSMRTSGCGGRLCWPTCGHCASGPVTSSASRASPTRCSRSVSSSFARRSAGSCATPRRSGLTSSSSGAPRAHRASGVTVREALRPLSPDQQTAIRSAHQSGRSSHA